jgi:hypothetical protein
MRAADPHNEGVEGAGAVELTMGSASGVRLLSLAAPISPAPIFAPGGAMTERGRSENKKE